VAFDRGIAEYHDDFLGRVAGLEDVIAPEPEHLPPPAVGGLPRRLERR
jgi:hypothetical protein